MRPIYSADILDAARALRAAPPEQRAGLARTLIAHADAGDRYRRRLRRCHPALGGGTLSAAARTHALSPAPTFYDAEFLNCLQHVITALIAMRTHQKV